MRVLSGGRLRAARGPHRRLGQQLGEVASVERHDPRPVRHTKLPRFREASVVHEVLVEAPQDPGVAADVIIALPDITGASVVPPQLVLQGPLRQPFEARCVHRRDDRLRPGRQLLLDAGVGPRLDVDVGVILTPPCMFCIENH